MNPIIIIPARMASTRLPDKPLAMIGDKPMIVQVCARAVQAGIGPVVVACDGERIRDAVQAAGYRAVITDPALPSGSDRIFAALGVVDPDGRHDIIINVQGDMPTLDPRIVKQVLAPLANPQVDIATLAAVMTDEAEKTDSAVVKLVISPQGRAISFSRYYDAGAYYHIGIYAYRRAALEKFVNAPPSDNELRQKLEQLRAMDMGMRIDAAVVDTVPLGVDTPEGLEKARAVTVAARQ